MPYDLYHDPAHGRLKALLGQYPGVAEQLKTASFEDNLDGERDSVFAWPSERRYPVHSREHALVSYLYTRGDPSVPAGVKLAVAEALEAYGVSKEALAPAPPAEDKPEDLLFPEQGTYPVRDAGEVKQAEERLLAQLGRLPLEARVPVFAKLANAAGRHGVTLQPASQAWGMAALTDPATLLDNLAARAHLAKTAEAKDGYLDLAEAVRTRPADLRRPEIRSKLASAIWRLDQQAGITQDRRIPDPLHAVYNHAIKVGARMVVLGPDSYDLGALTALPGTFYSDALGPEFAGEIAPGGQVDPEALSTILPTLPMDLKHSLAIALKGAGVLPTGI